MGWDFAHTQFREWAQGARANRGKPHGTQVHEDAPRPDPSLAFLHQVIHAGGNRTDR